MDATYRSDLRETNELNFARFMASVDQRFAELDVRLERRFAHSDVRLEKLRADVLKWMFIYWTGTMLAMAALVVTMLQRK
jgi:hypothetical protein